jgi:hypothetical protein
MIMNAGDKPIPPDEFVSGVRGMTSVKAPVVLLILNLEMLLMSCCAA